jgi:hypothetical protein
MKLIYCNNCDEIIKLTHSMRSCICLQSKGKYINHKDAFYRGDFAIPLYIDDDSFHRMTCNYSKNDTGVCYLRVVPKDDLSFERK